MSCIFTLEAAIALTCQQLSTESANDLLMRKMSEQRLPLPPTSGSGGRATGMDRLVADVMDLLGLLASDFQLVSMTVRVCTSCSPLLVRCG